jgi:SEFIR domain/TIR domain
MPPPIPRVFISYSHDSPRHEELVLALAERLRVDGIDAQIDQYVVGTPSEGWPRWMLNRLDWADFVLLICTKIYYQRFRGSDESARGQGADWEGQLVTLDLYNAKSRTVRFVPVTFSSEDEFFIPEPLRAHTRYVLVLTDKSSELQYANLYAFLTGQAGIQPRALGALKTLAPKKVTPIAFGVGEASELAVDESNKPVASLSSNPQVDSVQSLSQQLRFQINTRRSVYLSHASADRTIGQDLAGALRHAACKVSCHCELFVSNASLNNVAQAIASSDLMILLWSRAASISGDVSFEYNLAIALREPIVLCLLDDEPLRPPFDKKRGVKVDQLPDFLGHILDSLPEEIKQPPESLVKKILKSIPDVPVAEGVALERIKKNLSKQGLVNPRARDHDYEDVYAPDPDSKPNPVNKKILLGLGGVVSAAIVAGMGWLSDEKNFSTAVTAGQHAVSIAAAIFQSRPPPNDEKLDRYVLGWKQEILQRQSEDGGFRIMNAAMATTQAWTSAQCLKGLLSSPELMAANAKDIRNGFTYVGSYRVDVLQGGWGMWGQTQFPLTEITAWAILAEVSSMKEGIADIIWNAREMKYVKK